MPGGVAPRVARREVALMLGGLVVGVVSLGLAVRGEEATPTRAPAVAEVASVSGGGKLRPAATLVWRSLSPGAEVRDGDAVFVPPGGEATLRFSDGTSLSLDERSLVVVEPPRRGRRALVLRQGAVSGRAGDSGLVVASASGEALLLPGGEARAELGDGGLEVAVSRGRAELGALAIEAGGRGRAGAGAARALGAWPVALLEPTHAAHRWFQGAPPSLDLRWRRPASVEGLRLQVARDRLFAFIDVDVPVAGDAARLEQPRPGLAWWRVVDEVGRPLSEARRFSFTQDVAPTPVSPREGEVVLAPPGATAPFAWVPTVAATRFELQLSRTATFDDVAFAASVEGRAARLALPLEEGEWYWRVRARRGEGQRGPASAPTRFRLVHKPLPGTPLLLAPEVEVTP